MNVVGLIRCPLNLIRPALKRNALRETSVHRKPAQHLDFYFFFYISYHQDNYLSVSSQNSRKLSNIDKETEAQRSYYSDTAS